MSVLIDQHQAITDSLAVGNGDAAADEMREHLRRVFSDIAAVRESNPELFTLDASH
jgi:DNA-binding GntR family transcriptional regulator